MALAQRPRIGLKDVVYAVLDESTDVAGGTPVWGTIYPLSNALDMSFDPGSATASLFADDGLKFASDTVGEMKITLGVADLLPEHVARLLGHEYSAGQIIDNVSDQSPYVALGAKLSRSGKDGANEVYDYVWLYKVKLSKPKFDAKTKGSSIEYQTPMMEGLVCALTSSGDYRLRMRTDDPAASATTLTNFFTTVQLPGASMTAVSFASVAGDDSDNTITLTFGKSGESFAIANADDLGISVSVVSTGALIAGTSTYTRSVAGVAPTVTISNANITAVAYLVTVNASIKDTNGVAVTPTSRLVTPAA